MKHNSSLFPPSSPDLRQYDKPQRYNSPTKPYKHRFRGIILFRIKSVFGYYTDASASSGGERAHTVTVFSCSCCFAQPIILVSSLGSSIIATTDPGRKLTVCCPCKLPALFPGISGRQTDLSHTPSAIIWPNFACVTLTKHQEPRRLRAPLEMW